MSSHLIDYVVMKMNTMKTEITNLVTNMINNNKPKKVYYRGKLSHNNEQTVKFYVNGTNNHALNVKQSGNDFICNSSDNTELLIVKEGTYLMSFLDGFKSNSDSRLKIDLDKMFMSVGSGIGRELRNTNSSWETLSYTVQLYIQANTNLSISTNQASSILDGLTFSHLFLIKIA